MLCQFHITEIEGTLFCTKCKREQRSKYGPERTHRECRIEEKQTTDCKHRGEELRREQCPSCSGFVQVKVFGCTIHGECTMSKQINDLKTCNTCTDKVN
jgi:hypothetical protein